MSKTRKANVRKRLKDVDSVIQVLTETGVKCKGLEMAQQLPTEPEMTPREKYSVFTPNGKGYRKSLHKVPKFTRIPLTRSTPEGF